nr:uncharacterized protein LOC100182668 isoform X2 [Ciona intestinalis]|eukprot:XP_002123124.3 uncharacterized protein LOC100182668 isoform X2 [Ciona intestinalis]
MTQNQLSALGFHRAVVPTDMLDLLWDRTSDFSCTSSDDGEEHAAGDAIPPAPSTSEQARLICDDAIAHGHACHLVDGVVTSSNDVYQASSNIVQQTIGLSKEILLPMLRSYEKKTGSKISDADVPTTIRDLFNGVLELDEDELPDLVNVGGTGKTVVKPGKKDSSVRFDFSNTELPLVGALGHRQHRPPTPKRRVQFSSSDDSIEGVDLDMSESQMVLEQTIKVLASKVVTQVFEASNLPLDKNDMEERVAHLAGSVVNEIIAFETSSDEKRSTSPSLSECSGSSSTISVFSEASLNKKISWLAKEMIKDVVYEEPMGTPSNDHSDTDGSVMHRASTASDLSVLALHVVRSALRAVNSGVDFSCVNEGALYEQIEPLINDLSSKLIEQVMNERQPGRTHSIKTDKHHFAELENKISKLAINIVSSVLQGNTTSTSTSMTSLSSFTMETRVNEMTSGIVGAILNLKALLPSSYKPKSETNLCKDVKDMTVEDFIQEIFSLKALTNAPRRLFRNLQERDIQRISQNLAKKIVPDRDASSAFSSGIEDLAAAITDNAVKKVNQEASLWSEESSTPTIENAMKKLADAMVKETLQETSKISSDARSAVSSGLDDLATDAALTAIQRAENLSQESAVNSGASDLAGDVVSNAMLKAGDLGSSTDSAMSSGASIFAMDALKQSLQKLLLADSSTQSAVNSGLKHVSEDLIVESTALEVALANAGSLGSSSRSAFSSGMSLLAEEIAKLTITEGRSLVHGEVESVVSSAVSQMVIDTLAARVLERIMEKDSTNLHVPGNLEKLQSEIVKIVRSLVDARKSISNTTNTESQTASSATAGQSDLEKLITATDRSTISSAASVLAADIVRMLMGEKDEQTEETQQSSETEVSGKNVKTKTSDGISRKKHKSKEKLARKSGTKSTQVLNKGMTSSLPKATKCKSFASDTKPKAIYKSSFSNWRMKDDLKGETKNDQPLKVDGNVKTLNSKDQSSESTPEESAPKSEIQVLLDELASRIVKCALESTVQQPGTETSSNVNEAKSMDKLVESLALGVVTSLLGLDSLQSSTPPIASPIISTTASITDDTEKEESKGSTTLLPSAGPNLIREDTILKRREVKHALNDNRVIELTKIEDVEAKKCEEVTKMLQSTKTEPRRSRRNMSPCEDNAQNHPHRIPSPENTSCNPKSLRRRKTFRSPPQFSPYEKSPVPPRSKSGYRQRRGRRGNDFMFSMDNKN